MFFEKSMEVVEYMSNLFMSTEYEYMDNRCIYLDRQGASS